MWCEERLRNVVYAFAILLQIHQVQFLLKWISHHSKIKYFTQNIYINKTPEDKHLNGRNMMCCESNKLSLFLWLLHESLYKCE